ncbi:hypothetical protein [Pseudodesulfovibrio sediminis]|uniref:hypothetical protein n=1 Tax=Pseudodesulfovibrio sediminis TaxID=2810563 RepID=UPI001E4D6192|nr:hypothetical protein [Pseudodesulfovibrio sediminis]
MSEYILHEGNIPALKSPNISNYWYKNSHTPRSGNKKFWEREGWGEGRESPFSKGFSLPSPQLPEAFSYSQ